jgi:hypothetical protein
MYFPRPGRGALLSLIVSASTLLLLCVGCGSDSSKKTPTTPVVNHVAGADCGGCHTAEHQNWALTLHAASPSEVLLNTEHNTAELLTDECIGCHAPFQAASHHIGDFVQPINQTGPWSLVAGSDSLWQAIKCEVCHDPTSDAPKMLAFHDPVTQTYVAVSDATELCEKCHQPGTDDSRDLAGSVHQGIQCSSCHNQAGSQMRLDPHGSCSHCHPGVNPGHPDVTQLNTTYLSLDSPNNIHFITCTTCHAAPGSARLGSPEARHP